MYTAQKIHSLHDIQVDFWNLYIIIQDGFFGLKGLEGEFEGLAYGI